MAKIAHFVLKNCTNRFRDYNMNLIKRCYAFKCLFALFLPVCPALIGRVARYTPSSELNIQTKRA